MKKISFFRKILKLFMLFFAMPYQKDEIEKKLSDDYE